MREITIRPILNGWLCKVGCAEIAFLDEDFMVSELKKYITNPKKVEAEYLENAKNPHKKEHFNLVNFKGTQEVP